MGTVLWVEPGLPIPGVSPEEQLCEEACLQDGELVESILQCEGSHWWHQKLFKGRENDAYPRSQSQTIRHGRLLFHLSFLTNMLLLLFVSRFLCLWVAFCAALVDETFDTKNDVYDFFLGRLTVALVSPGLEIEPPYMWRSLGLSALGLLKKKHEVNT